LSTSLSTFTATQYDRLNNDIMYPSSAAAPATSKQKMNCQRIAHTFNLEIYAQAFRDWGLELTDWQTTCSSLGKKDVRGSLNNICRCMMPTGMWVCACFV
jgi:hypothetical protein